MTGTVFVDTNVLVYRKDASEPEKQSRAQEWMTHLWNEHAGRVSAQVLNEFYVTVTRKLDPGLDEETARGEVRPLFAWRPVSTDPVVIETAWRLCDRFHFAFWDGLIVAAALLSGCRYVLTEDLQDGQEVEGLRIVNPFVHRPQDLE